MKFRIRSKRNRRRNWTDRIGQALIGSKRDPLSPEQVVHRAIVFVALLLPYFVWSHGPTVIHQGKKLYGRYEARKAEQLRLSGRSDAALCMLMHAYDRTPDEIQIVRGIAWAAAPAFPVQAKQFIQKLTDAEAATPEDLMLQASLLLSLDQAAEAATIYQALVKHQPKDPDIWRAWAVACHQRGELSEAMKAYRRVLGLSPHDLQATVGIADLILRSGTAQDTKAATALLLTQLDRAVGAKLANSRDVADLLVRLTVTDPEQRSRLANLLRRMPDPKSEHILAGIFLSHPVEPSPEEGTKRRDEVKAFLAQHRTLEFQERKAIALELQKRGEDALVLDWISLAEAAGDPVMLAQRLDALMTCGLWKEAAELAEHPATAETAKHQTWLHTLSVLRTCREPKAMAENMLSQSLIEAAGGSHFTACHAIGYAALDYGLHSLASRAFAQAIEHGSDTATPLKEYLHAARRSGEPASGVMKVIANRARTEREDEALQVQSIYLRLLCGDEIERAALDLAQLRQHKADEPYLKFLNAFMRYRHGDYTGAVKALLPLPSHRWHQGETVVISTILAAGGQVRQAAQLASKITGEGVFAEEKKMLDAWQSRAVLDSTLLSSVSVAP